MQVTAVLTPAPDSGFVAYNPETGTTTQGDTVEESLVNLREAVELYLEEFATVFAGAPLVTSIDVPVHAWMAGVERCGGRAGAGAARLRAGAAARQPRRDPAWIGRVRGSDA